MYVIKEYLASQYLIFHSSQSLLQLHTEEELFSPPSCLQLHVICQSQLLVLTPALVLYVSSTELASL